MSEKKLVEFPYSGSGGKGDSWEGTIEVELTDEEIERLKASEEKYLRFVLADDVDDIYSKVYERIVDNELEVLRFMIDELRDDNEMDEDATDREVIEEHLDSQGMCISYPDYYKESDDE